MNSLRLLGWEMRLQQRYGMGVAAAFVAVSWIVILRLLPEASHVPLLPIVVVMDAAIFGFFLMTGMMFLEKSDRVLSALVATPLTARRYLATKIVALTLLALAACVAITAAVHGGATDWVALVVGVALVSVMTMLAGFILAARFNTINEYLLPSSAVLLLVQAPVFDHFGLWSSPAFYVLPPQAALVLVRGAFEPLALWEWVYGVGYCVVTIVGLFAWATRTFDRFVAGGASERASRRSSPRTTTRFRGLTALTLSDLRNLRRDPIAIFMLVYAVVVSFVGRWLLPWGFDRAAPWIDLEPYTLPIVSFLALQAGPLLLGAVLGLMLLDERDDRSLLALRCTPISMAQYGVVRGFVPVIVSVCLCFAGVYYVGLVDGPPLQIALVSGLAALEAPIVGLLLATFAGNKVEGLALMKGMSLLMFPPAVAWFFDAPVRYAFGIIPTLWPAEAFWRACGHGGAPWWPLAVGYASHGALLWWLGQRFKSKTAQ